MLKVAMCSFCGRTLRIGRIRMVLQVSGIRERGKPGEGHKVPVCKDCYEKLVSPEGIPSREGTDGIEDRIREIVQEEMPS